MSHRRAPHVIALSFAALLAAVTSACSNDAQPGSCYRPADNACVGYARERAAAGKRLCSGMTWTAGEGSCPALGRVGTCAHKEGSEIVYSGAPNNYPAVSAKTACEHAGGAFSSGTSP